MYRQKNTAGYAGSSGQENIGFAREGKECLYNILIMEEMQSIVDEMVEKSRDSIGTTILATY